MFKDFKKFLMQGNIVDLAVAVVIGVAFGALVKSLVTNILTPIIAIPGKTDFSALTVEINGSTFLYGAFINDAITFISVAAVVFFFVVKPMEALMARTKKEEEETTRECSECLSEIPVAAHCCRACGSVQLITT
jgi:large conductance mechanosensitive channel